MDNLSKVIFTFLAIGYTFLIYQNNQLKDDIDTLKGYAQLDTDKSFDEIDKIKSEFEIFKNNTIEIQNNNANVLSEFIEVMNSNTSVINDISDDVDDNESDIESIAQSLSEIEISIRRIPKPKSTYQIKSIIENCTTNKRSFDTHNHKLEC